MVMLLYAMVDILDPKCEFGGDSPNHGDGEFEDDLYP
jgi:hypothetical protein